MVKIGTRGSKLALWQANYLQTQLAEHGVESKIQIIKTKGDKIQHLSFDKLEGKGFFTKELEDALLNEKVDVAVHSMKDLPTTNPEGLCITAVSYRANPTDSLLIRKDLVDNGAIYKLKKGAVVGTSSARRKCQILHYAPHVNVKDIRGNVPTRIQKLRDGDYDAILLASAGIERLQLDISDLEHIELFPREFIPAPAQGVLAYQCRVGDVNIRKIFSKIHNSEVSEVTNIERKILRMFDGGCQLPFGLYCYKDSMGYYHAYGVRSDTWNGPATYAHISQSTTFQLAEKLFEKLK
jgi:hydroxymethylbilane synthase